MHLEPIQTQATALPCPVWPGLCTDTQPAHSDHFNHQHRVNDKNGDRLLDVGFAQLADAIADGPAVVYIGREDYAPHEVRQITTELRRLLDVADAIADRLIATGSGQPRPCSACGGAGGTVVDTSSGGVTRQSWKTCGACGGTGVAR